MPLRADRFSMQRRFGLAYLLPKTTSVVLGEKAR